jgi:carbonic anhydrase
MSVLEDVRGANEAYVAGFTKGDLVMPPARQFAVLTCMDARIDPARALGLEEGDAHVIRNAGGAITEDAIRSLVISQRLLGTREIILIHHTDCGMLTFTDEGLKRDIQGETGIRPPFAFEPFPELDEDVRQSLARVRTNPFIPHRTEVRGFVYDVRTGRLREVK